MRVPLLNVDIEPTNRCNADCYFCPRDMTPDEGLLYPEVFDAALARVLELREELAGVVDLPIGVSLCGLGEPLINKHTPEYVEKIKAADLYCGLSTNGGLLDEKRATRLLDAGLDSIHINAGETHDVYEEIYKLPWERTRDNVVRFAEMARGRCEVRVVLVNHRRSPDYVKKVKRYWERHGIEHFDIFRIMNRGGALVLEGVDYGPERTQAAMDLYEEHGEVPPCIAPFVFPFVGYDGQWYLCCSDWTKEVPFGSVFDTSFVDTVAGKWAYSESRSGMCATCSVEPVNQLIDRMDAFEAGEISEKELHQLVGRLQEAGEQAHELAGQIIPLAKDRGRRPIPVRAV